MSLEVSWALQTDRQTAAPGVPAGLRRARSAAAPAARQEESGKHRGRGQGGQGGLRYLRRWEQGASQHLASDKMNW